jgi:hypothetical protein
MQSFKQRLKTNGIIGAIILIIASIIYFIGNLKEILQFIVKYFQ